MFKLLYESIIIIFFFYEIIKYCNYNSNFNNNNFIILNIRNNRIIFYLKKNNDYIIDKYTKKYILNNDLEFCIFTLENIQKGTEIRELKCGHIFQKKYIDEWLLNNDECPNCRQNFITYKSSSS